MSVDQTLVAALKATALVTTSAAPSAALWQGKTVDSSTTSPFELRVDADAEGVRQAAFLDGPRAVDEHVIPGRWNHLLAQTVRLFSDRLGYEAGAVVFVLGADPAGDGTTTLTVLKRLAP